MNPVELYRWYWPDSYLYDKQWEILLSVFRDDSTFVVAGNMLGKDYVAGRIVPLFFLTRRPCRIVTTSAKDAHLSVLWGEMTKAIDESPRKLRASDGGPLVVNRRLIRKIHQGIECPLSYVEGMVASPDTIESMGGHHVAAQADGIPRTLFAGDEASGIPDEYFPKVNTWAVRKLLFGNAWDCENEFKRAFKGDAKLKDPGGDIVDPDNPRRYVRKTFHLGATDSPNVRYGLEEKARGKKPTNRIIIPGVKPYKRYAHELRTLPPELKCIVLDGDWWEGEETKLCPPAWLRGAALKADELIGAKRKARVIGVDVGEGGDDTVACVADHLGVIELEAKKTADTSVIVPWLKGLIHVYGVDARSVFLDLGGGGKEHVDRLRSEGIDVQGVYFAESPRPPKDYWSRVNLPEEMQEGVEESAAFKNRRAQMYWMVRMLICPTSGDIWGIPAEYTELHRQLSMMPVIYEPPEGKIAMLPKRGRGKTETEDTLIKRIGHSPDEADAVALAAFALGVESYTITVGAL